ncbi:Two-component response regulator SSK1p [Recurvomyces mirabilis]|uniref:Two-component response regulator SSK1p n=1 Tax=Recurvomyces mirabilis TaxID=574656 RepID=UPI002DDDF345|nr:Two-component response regulator SSK1p [Recurvomyces mirabilis]
MARGIFALGRLFKRSNSANTTTTFTTTTTTTSTSTSSTGTTTPPSEQQPTRNLPQIEAVVSPQQAGARTRRSASLTKLREKGRGTELAESVAEVRESVLLVGELPSPAATDLSPARSGSETLGGGEGEVPTRDVSASPPPVQREDKVVLDPPVVQIQAPTPDVEAKELLGRHWLERNDTAVDTPLPAPSYQPRLDDEVSSLRSVSPNTVPADGPQRHQLSISTAHPADEKVVETVIDAPASPHPNNISSALNTSTLAAYFTPALPDMSQLLHRKIWVRRPGASATMVQLKADDLVDDVRDMILKKYANSLGRTFDAPDMTLRILLRAEAGQPRVERVLGPEEEMCRTIDEEFTGGQKVEDALIIDVPVQERRTPRPSPRAYHHPSYHMLEDYRPVESGTDYFPPMPAVIPPSMPQTTSSHDGSMNSSRGHHPSIAGLHPGQEPRSIAVLSTGQIPPLPSPGSVMRNRGHPHRPKVIRQHTASPTILSHPSQINNSSGVPLSAAAQSSLNVNPQLPLVHRGSTRPRNDSMASETLLHHSNTNGMSVPSSAIPQPPTPPAPETLTGHQAGSTPPTPSQLVAPGRRIKKAGGRKIHPDKSGGRSSHQRSDSQTAKPSTPNSIPGLTSVLDSSVPPISVLIVEDNIINLRILEGLMKRLKVRWQTAMNGAIALDKWRQGGYHLVLMDIQMPVMNGLQATKEIRRLERVNGIGVFSADPGSVEGSPAEKEKEKEKKERQTPNGAEVPSSAVEDGDDKSKPSDLLPMQKQKEGTAQLFKSPVIIVALTASSLQSDRHEALAAGCNDFLTKPVSFVWLERKVKEWGCMQALIDFDGWRRWKEFAAREDEGKTEVQREVERGREEKERGRVAKMAKLQEIAAKRKEKEEEEKRRKRVSLLAQQQLLQQQAGEVGTSVTTTNGEGSGATAEGSTNGVAQSEG